MVSNVSFKCVLAPLPIGGVLYLIGNGAKSGEAGADADAAEDTKKNA